MRPISRCPSIQWIARTALAALLLAAPAACTAKAPSPGVTYESYAPDLAAASAAADLARGPRDFAVYTRDLTESPPQKHVEPPRWPCGTDAAFPETSRDTCDLPPSVCADGRWIQYYVNGRCVNGWCQWDVRFLDCSPNGEWMGCENGGCVFNGTAMRPASADAPRRS